MNKKNLLVVFASLSLFSCRTITITQFAITSENENLYSLTQITNGENVSQSPFGGDEGKDLFYQTLENGYYHIYKKENVLSASAVQKTGGNLSDNEVTYSRKRDEIAFRRGYDIYIMSATKGKALKQITDTPNHLEGSPNFSKDGKFLIYQKESRTVAAYDGEIWLKNLETNENILLGNGYFPNISPDGTKIVYVKYESPYGASYKRSSIWIMDIDGENQSLLIDAQKGWATAPSWSPDGNRIIFQWARTDKADVDIYVVDIDGENLTQLTQNESFDGQPYWSSDNYIYFCSDRGGKKGNYQIWRFKFEE